MAQAARADNRSLLERLVDEAGGPEAFARMWDAQGEEERARRAYDWSLLARANQLPPPGDWTHWLVLAGRGFGKTRVGAEWTRTEVYEGRAGRVALIAPTAADARDTMVEGESGILAVSPPWFRPTYEPSKRRLTWPNGAQATLFSAEEANRLRGPQHDLGWLDEMAAWPDERGAWDMFKFGLRLGDRPRAIITTTPRPTKLIRELCDDAATVVTRGSTYENASNLAASFLDDIRKRYEGTRLGRQEIHAEVLEDNPGALWRMGDIDGARVKAAPEMRRVVIGVDPAVSTNKNSDETGIIAAGIGVCRCKVEAGGQPELHAFVIEDLSGIHTPAEWARAVLGAYTRQKADRVIAEINQGGQLVEQNLRANAVNLPIKTVHASKGKAIRAEPVASLYEQRKVHHVGGFAKLEDQMVSWNPVEDSYSPDRVDALVYALTELMLQAVPPVYRGAVARPGAWR